MRFDELWVGDRFVAYDALWTKIGHGCARKHGKESMVLGDSGHGYRGDTLCSFESEDDVRFLPPNAELTGARSASE